MVGRGLPSVSQENVAFSGETTVVFTGLPMIAGASVSVCL